jgi:hypothetical protein
LGRIVKVDCHSGYTYAERPVSVEIDDQKMEITKIRAESRTPTGRKFKVQISDGREIDLVYIENKDEWEMSE